MVIESVIFKGQSVKFKDVLVKFDKGKGQAEVDSELGKYIVDNFSTIWVKGKKPVEIKKEEALTNNDAEIFRLKQEIERLMGVIADKNKEISEAKKAEKIWREEYEKLSKGIKTEKGPISNIPPKKEKSTKINVPEGFEELYEEMKKKNVNQLRKWIKEELKTDADLKGKSRDELIQFVFDNVG